MARANGTTVAVKGAKTARCYKCRNCGCRDEGSPRRPVWRLLRWHPGRRHDTGPWPDLRAPLDPPGRPPYDEITWEYRTAGIANESGKSVFEQKDVEVPDFWSQLATNVVGQQVLPRPPRHAGARDLRPPADRPGRQHDHGLGGDPALLRDRHGPPDLQGRADPPDRPPEDGLQLAGLVQRRHRSQAPVLGLLHQLGRRHDVLDHGPGQDRGDALQVRLGRRHQPLHHPLVQARRWPAAAPPRAPSPS